MIAGRANRLVSAMIIAGLLIPLPGWGQEPEVPVPPPSYTAPSREAWLEAHLDPDEYTMALRYEVTLEEWKEMDRSRQARLTAGWACIGIALLAPAIEATVIWGGGVDYTLHPEMEVFIVVNVAALATLVTGIVLATTAPGPEKFKTRWMMKEGQASIYLAPSPGGLGLGFSF
jgi:hypothetical protein